MTIIVQPRLPGQRWWKRVAGKLGQTRLVVRRAGLQQLNAAANTLIETLRDYGARRLGYRGDGPIRFTEIGEALYLIRTGRERQIPLVSGSLGASIMTDRPVVDERHRRFRLMLPGETRWGANLGFREYMQETAPGMLNGLLSAPFDFVMTNSFRFMLRAQAQAKTKLKADQFGAVKEGSSLEAGLEQVQDDVDAGRTVLGDHHFGLTVLADDPRELDRLVNKAETALSNAGAIAAVEDVGLEAALIATLPGTWEYRPRPGAITSWNFTHLSSLENYPTGQREGYWGPSVARFMTNGGTPYDFVTHVEDVGHMAFFGRTGTGKTLLAAFLGVMQEQTGATGLVFDKDGASEIWIRLTGGRYLKLRRGQPSGMAPLKGLDYTPASRAFLKLLFTGLIELDGHGKLTPDEEARLVHGIARQMEMPAELRSLQGIRERLGYSDPQGAGARFEKWCRGGSMGWLLDNEEDLIRQDAHLLGYDLTELLPAEEGMADDGSAQAAVSYIIHRARKLLDGRRVWMFCDECRFYLPVLGRVLEDMSLTGRKLELALWLAAQEPEHLVNDPIGNSIIKQCRTVIAFPHSEASFEGYVRGLRFTRAEFEALTGDMLIGNARGFLLKRESGSVICRFDLSALPHHLKALSARAGTSRILARLIETHGDDPARLWPAFRAATEGRIEPINPWQEAAE
ncbi:MAG: type IV secretion system protein VirB4 [Acetobacteraceae bacterium]